MPCLVSYSPCLSGRVVVGGIKRIGAFAARLVPGMVLLYGGTSLLIILTHADQIFPSLSLILSDAFTGQAVAGGALGMVIVTGVRRAAFSNEAGMGTERISCGQEWHMVPPRPRSRSVRDWWRCGGL